MVSARSGVAPSALRFYEEQGLIESVRSAGGTRRFRRSTLRRIAFIRAAQNVGLSLEEISAALGALPGGRTPTRADWARLSRTFRERIDTQIEALERLREDLTDCIGCGCLSLRRCTLYNPRDELAEQGSGARRLPARLRAGGRG